MLRLGVAACLCVSSLSSASMVQWKASDGGNDHWYEIRTFSASIKWQDAAAIATAAGGYLATLTSAQENEFVYNLSMTTPGAWHRSTDPIGVWFYGPWLGGFRDASSPSGWSWTTGEAWNFESWYFNQPDSAIQKYLAFGVGVNDTPAPVWADTFEFEPVRSLVIEYNIPTPATSAALVASLIVARRRRR
jgi:hypothetical protein